jgi:hypothetical protein
MAGRFNGVVGVDIRDSVPDWTPQRRAAARVDGPALGAANQQPNRPRPQVGERADDDHR